MGLSIAEVAEFTGLTAHTLRYYERAGLMIHDPERTSSGHRSYSARAVDGIVLITRLRSTGMPIRDIRAYVRLCREGLGNEADRLALLRAHRERMMRELDDLQGHLRAVDHKIALYDDLLTHGRSDVVDSCVPEATPNSARVLTSSALEGVESPT